MKTTNVDEFLKSGQYLPDVLRDFHDQKDIFKAMHEIVQETPDATIKRPDWVTGQCYVIDVFLWFMARRGYTLQRTRRRGNFRDLGADVRMVREEQDKRYAAALGLTPFNVRGNAHLTAAQEMEDGRE